MTVSLPDGVSLKGREPIHQNVPARLSESEGAGAHPSGCHPHGAQAWGIRGITWGQGLPAPWPGELLSLCIALAVLMIIPVKQVS